MVKKIDQSEFEGFEYINPLLMSAEECVWGMWQLYRRVHTHTCIHTHSHSCTCYVVSQCPRAAWLWDSLMTSTRSGAAHAQQNAYLPKPVWHSAIYNHLPLSLPSFLIIFISCKSALISILSSGASLSIAVKAAKFFQGFCTQVTPRHTNWTSSGSNWQGVFHTRFICVYRQICYWDTC